MKNLFNDTYPGRRWTYGLQFRPLDSSNVPAGWIIGTNFDHPDFNHGVVQYPRPLSKDEIASYQLIFLPEQEAKNERRNNL